MAREYERFAAMPPAPINRCASDCALDRLAIAVSVNYNFTHKLMREFVAATENYRAYIGFLNDVNRYVKEKQMDEVEAMAFVAREIQANDLTIEDPEKKVWPRVVDGINAANAMNPQLKLRELAPVAVAVTRAVEDCQRLQHSFRQVDATMIEKGICAAIIIKQGYDTIRCLSFITTQLRRTMLAKFYAKESASEEQI